MSKQQNTWTKSQRTKDEIYWNNTLCQRIDETLKSAKIRTLYVYNTYYS